jgi:hypothetical protein
MRKVYLDNVIIVLLVVILIIIGTAFYLFQFGGLRQYLRAESVINNSQTVEIINQAREIFDTQQGGPYSGIFGGIIQNKIWVWGSFGLKFFTTDNFSVYFTNDGCNNEAKTLREKDPSKQTVENIYYDMKSWEKNTNVGDFVVIRTSKAGMGGTLNNLREIHSYNYWPFILNDISIACSK